MPYTCNNKTYFLIMNNNYWSMYSVHISISSTCTYYTYIRTCVKCRSALRSYSKKKKIPKNLQKNRIYVHVDCKHWTSFKVAHYTFKRFPNSAVPNSWLDYKKYYGAKELYIIQIRKYKPILWNIWFSKIWFSYWTKGQAILNTGYSVHKPDVINCWAMPIMIFIKINQSKQ